MPSLKSRARLTVLAVLCATLVGTTGLATATEAGSYAKALAQAEAENKILVIDFYTDW